MRKIPSSELREINIMGIGAREVFIKAKSKSRKAQKKNFLFIGGHHSSLEKLHPITDYLSDFGNVYFPEMPGFGSAPSFAAAGRKITIDNYAQYINEYISLRQLDNIYWMPNSIATLYAIRALQKFPDLQKRTSKVLALVGLCHGRDFNMPKWKWHSIKSLSYLLLTRPSHHLLNAALFKNPVTMPVFMAAVKRANKRHSGVTPEVAAEATETERTLWQTEDHQTHAASTLFMFGADLEGPDKIPFTMHNITTREDQYFDQDSMASSMQNLFTGYERYILNFDQHAPAYIEDKEQFSKYITPEITELLDS